MSQAIQDYIDQVVAYANPTEREAPRIRQELEDHLHTKREALIAQGQQPEDAVYQAVKEHGPAMIVGYKLRRWRLVDVRLRGTARGWIAIGPKAVGGIALGGFAMGGVAFGGLGCGGFTLALLLAWGGVAVGPLAMGGVAAGLVASGGIAVGLQAFGGVAAGVYRRRRRVASVGADTRLGAWIRWLGPTSQIAHGTTNHFSELEWAVYRDCHDRDALWANR